MEIRNVCFAEQLTTMLHVSIANLVDLESNDVDLIHLSIKNISSLYLKEKCKLIPFLF